MVLILLYFTILVNDGQGYKTYSDVLWTFGLRGDDCGVMDQCEVDISTDNEDADAVETTIRLNWHDASSWQSASGPQWKDADGNSPAGVPENGASVNIPTGRFGYICTLRYLRYFNALHQM